MSRRSMPRRRNPCSYLPRRLQIVASVLLFLLLSILLLGTTRPTPSDYIQRVPGGSTLQASAQNAVSTAQRVAKAFPKLPKNVVNAPAWLKDLGGGMREHSPEEEGSSDAGMVKWFSDWAWRNPFSSSITMDEERSVLPPERRRPPIYTYFDSAGRRKDEQIAQAEKELLQIWRRAWWAKGFKPVVLGPADAKKNAGWKTLQELELSVEMNAEMVRWLAWGSMGTGVLCNWLALPMAAYDDPLVSFLRTGEYSGLTRYTGLEGAFYVGSKEYLDQAIRTALESAQIKEATTISDAVPKGTFTLDDQHDAIAYYSTAAIKAKYPSLHEKLAQDSTHGEGLALLPSLITSHLHQTWQNVFTSGIAVLQPLPQHTTTLHLPALSLAQNLTHCPTSPIPASCPPNIPTCKPCLATQQHLITTPPEWRNTSTLFTLATVPHPYTTTSLLHSRSDLNVKFVRRETERDSWISAATREALGVGPSSFARLRPLKDAIASEYGAQRSLWLTAENPLEINNPAHREELAWFLGFPLPSQTLSSGKSNTPVPGPERRPRPPPKSLYDFAPPSTADLAAEQTLLDSAKAAVTHAGKLKVQVLQRNLGVLEAWSLADAEIWRFVRAWEARRGVERREFEEEEKKKGRGRGLLARWVGGE